MCVSSLTLFLTFPFSSSISSTGEDLPELYEGTGFEVRAREGWRERMSVCLSSRLLLMFALCVVCHRYLGEKGRRQESKGEKNKGRKKERKKERKEGRQEGRQKEIVELFSID